ncbi:hypothetical protein QA601_18400 [Chitinispirillales bacterium ANBcel5]|uniref:hypothetical protein n=1 Tax=Cellulosispirillum alkaliphilum TaxID=3039283 RepID=UPI002A502BAB|nr:hypothetical protein [Chitinispirillales bacterium ANBcel5]
MSKFRLYCNITVMVIAVHFNSMARIRGETNLVYEDGTMSIYTDSTSLESIDRELVLYHYDFIKRALEWTGEGLREECEKATTAEWSNNILLNMRANSYDYRDSKVKYSFNFNGKMIFSMWVDPHRCANKEILKGSLCTTATENDGCVSEISEETAIGIARGALMRILEEYNVEETYQDFDSVEVIDHDVRYYTFYIRSKQKTIVSDSRSVQVKIDRLTGEIRHFSTRQLVSPYDLNYIPKISKEEAIRIADERVSQVGTGYVYGALNLAQREIRGNKYWTWNVYYYGDNTGNMPKTTIISVDSEDGTIRRAEIWHEGGFIVE